MEGIKRLFHFIRGESLKEFAWESLRSWVWPVLLPVLTVVLGYFDRQPKMYILLAALAAFSFVTHGLVKITEWRLLRSPENKINFISPRIGIVNKNKENPEKIDGFKLGFTLVNKAFFSLELEVESIKTRFYNRVNPSPVINRRIFDLSPGSEFFFYDDFIDTSDIDLANKELNGFIEFSVKYGVPRSARKFKYKKSIEIYFAFGNDGQLKHSNWFEAAEKS